MPRREYDHDNSQGVLKSAGVGICGQKKRKKKTFPCISGVESPGLERENLISTGLLENIIVTEGKYISWYLIQKYYKSWHDWAHSSGKMHPLGYGEILAIQVVCINLNM